MSTSGVTTYNLNRDQLIRGALRLAGGLAQGETPTNDQYTEANEALNVMVKAMMGLGMPLWAVKKYEITLTANAASYRIGVGQTVATPKPLKIYQAWIRYGTTNDAPVQIVSRQEYNQLGNKTSTGTPVQIYYDPQNTYGDLYVYPVADATVASTKTLFIVYQRPFEDFVAATDDPDFPQEWTEALKYGLAVRLAPEYGLDKGSRTMLFQEYQIILNQAQGFNQEEASVFMQPDYRDYRGTR